MAKHPHFLWADLFGAKRRNAYERLAELLAKNVIFSTLSPRELSYLSRVVYERYYQPKEIIFKENHRSIGMYLVAKGRVSIWNQTPEGENLITNLGPGAFFGERALTDSESFHTATATSEDNTLLIGFFKPDLMQILNRKPEMGVKILYQLSQVLGKRLLETTEKITLLTQASNYGRVHGDIY